MTDYPTPPYPEQQQAIPGRTEDMNPRPDHGESSYKGSGRLAGKKTIVTGGDSGIGRAVALAFAREGADVLIAYLEALEDISDDEWQLTFATNIHAMFYLSKAAVAHMGEGASIINTTSINAQDPNQQLLAYATTKGAIYNFTSGLGQMLAERKIRVNAVAPGPVWTPLIPSTMPPEAVKTFGENTPLGRAAQPAELAPAYVLLASDESSYITGATIPVTGGRAFL
jgi:NAD(P)-dependent dehydrogenase (short-subunit alcohol dehydrogenase family)